MTSFKTQLVLQLLSVYTVIYDISHIFIVTLVDLYNYLNSYIKGYNDHWAFIKGCNLPLPKLYIFNKVDINASYDNRNIEFEILNPNSNTEPVQECKYSWLSAKLRINDKDWISEFEIDDFLHKLKIITYDNNVPSLRTLFILWCIYSRYWFKMDRQTDIEFLIIDDMGDEHTLNIFDAHCFNIKSGRIYLLQDVSDTRSTPELSEPALSD
jgi:hypothetical protein